ncbi:MAG: serine/threonine-protein kinase, partial [Planctomycetota bacterium]
MRSSAKTLSQQLAQDEEFTARFIREARTAAMLDHVNIIRGLDVGSEGDVHYFAMEFVEGESVGGILERDGKMPEDRALHIIIQVARALECAWTTKQIIHRDIKPDNILVTKGDIAKVADLGLAK